MTNKETQASAGVASELNAELGFCINCEYWCRDKDKFGHYSGEAHNLGLGQCVQAEMLFNCVQWDKNGERTTFCKGIENKKAFVQDGSDYKAWLLTKPEFGCVSWRSVRLPTPTNGINFTGGDSNMSNNEKAIEQEIQDKGLTAPRLTPALIDAAIKGEDYHVFGDTCLTVCCLTLQNGFTVTGESACASPENFNAEIGRKIARENARNKIWMLEGYLLKQRLFETQNCTPIANFG